MRRIWLKLVMTYFLISNAYASDATTLVNTLNAIHTMRASFTQTVYDNRNKQIQQSTGQMALERPGRFRWEIKQPIPQLIIANQTKLWIYDPDLEQVTIRSLAKAAGETPALLLSHVNAAIEKDFAINEIKKEKSDWQWFLLTPKKADNMFSSVQMGFKNKQLQEMELADHLGHKTKVEYKNIVINQNLSQDLFNFKAPKQVDVIDETKK